MKERKREERGQRRRERREEETERERERERNQRKQLTNILVIFDKDDKKYNRHRMTISINGSGTNSYLCIKKSICQPISWTIY
jgi:type VI protein secretion system component VasA